MCARDFPMHIAVVANGAPTCPDARCREQSALSARSTKGMGALPIHALATPMGETIMAAMAPIALDGAQTCAIGVCRFPAHSDVQPGLRACLRSLRNARYAGIVNRPSKQTRRAAHVTQPMSD